MTTQITFNAVTAEIKASGDLLEAFKHSLGVHIEEEDADLILEKTSFPIEKGISDSNYHLIQIIDGNTARIATGLIALIGNKSRVLEVTTQYTKLVKSLPPLLQKEFNPKLRFNQRQFVEAALKKKRGVIQAPTSFGKSYSISEFLSFFDPSVVRLVVVPTVSLLYQMQKDISDYLEIPKEDIGLIGDGKLVFKNITIAIPDTLANKASKGDLEVIKFMESVGVAVFDECHCYTNVTGIITSQFLVNTEYRIGCSATPFVKVPLLLEGLIGPKIAQFSIEEQMEQGFIMKPVIHFVESPAAYAPSRLLNFNFSTADWKDTKTMYLYNSIYDFLIVNNKGRNLKAAEIAYEKIQQNNGPILILVKKVGTTSKNDSVISHSDIFQELFQEKYGIHLPIIHGKTATKKQQEIFDQLESCKIPAAIASTGILSMGVSIKSIVALILLAGGSGGPGQRDLIQRIGRVLRPKAGKVQPEVYDFIDPEVGGQAIFYKQSQKRIACAKEEYPNCVKI